MESKIYRLIINGITVETEDPQSVLRLIDAATQNNNTTETKSPIDKDQAAIKFTTLINTNQVSVLRIIRNHPEGISVREIATALNCSNNSVSGYIGGGIRKNIPKAGLSHEDILITKRVGSQFIYYPGPTLLRWEL